MVKMAAFRLFLMDCTDVMELAVSAFLGLLLTMTFFLCCLELLHSAENKHVFVLHKMMVFTFMFWIGTGLLKTMVFGVL